MAVADGPGVRTGAATAVPTEIEPIPPIIG